MSKWEVVGVVSAFSLFMSVSALCGSLFIERKFFGVADLILSPITKELPDSFIVPDTFDTASRNFNEMTMNIATSFVTLLEAFYRHEGSKAKYLKNHSSVVFSEIGFAKVLNNSCSSASPPSFCRSGPMPGPVISYFLDSFPDIMKSVVPRSVCSGNECNGMTAFVGESPLEFELKGTKWVKTVHDIKQLIYEHRQPLYLSMPVPEIVYKTNESTRRFPAITMSGEFVIPRAPTKLSTGPPTAFVVYGWNDDFVCSYGAKPMKSVGWARGGLIVKGNYNEIGHTLPFLAGQVTGIEDGFHCSNDLDALQWEAVSANVTKGSDAKWQILKCVNESLCETGSEYAFVKSPYDKDYVWVTEEESGLVSVKMMKFDGDNATVVDFKGFPLHMLHRAFVPKKVRAKAGSECGYWMIPYDLLERLDRTGNDAFNRVVAGMFNISWSEKSFAGESDAFPYAEIVASTVNVTSRIKFRGTSEMIHIYEKMYQAGELK